MPSIAYLAQFWVFLLPDCPVCIYIVEPPALLGTVQSLIHVGDFHFLISLSKHWNSFFKSQNDTMVKCPEEHFR